LLAARALSASPGEEARRRFGQRRFSGFSAQMRCAKEIEKTWKSLFLLVPVAGIEPATY
jgi:hypothetical protein